MRSYLEILELFVKFSLIMVPFEINLLLGVAVNVRKSYCDKRGYGLGKDFRLRAGVNVGLPCAQLFDQVYDSFVYEYCIPIFRLFSFSAMRRAIFGSGICSQCAFTNEAHD